MADLFAPVHPKGYGRFETETPPEGGLSEGGSNDPLSPRFTPPVAKGARGLVRYLVACQVERYKQVVDVPHIALVRGAAKVLRQYPMDVAQRGVRRAVMVSAFPFSFKFVERVLQDVVEQCPFLDLTMTEQRPARRQISK